MQRGETRDGHLPRLDEVAEHSAWAHGRQLVGVAHQNEPRTSANRIEQRCAELDVDHGALVHHDDVGLDGRMAVASPAVARVKLEQAVHRARFSARSLVHALCGFARGRGELVALPGGIELIERIT